MTEPAAPPSDWLVISSEDGWSVAVPEHNDENRRMAARVLVHATHSGDASEAPGTWAWLAEQAQEDTFRQHVNRQPSEAGCGCAEDDGSWWCPFGDGPATPYYTFEIKQVYGRDGWEYRAADEVVERAG